jgi:low affinity Fe/Cu permease
MPDQNDKNGQPAFDRFTTLAARWMGQGVIFAIAALFTLGWAVSAPIFHFSNAWQLIINTTTTVLTFLMVFLIQNTLNRDSAAIHVKLDELVYVTAQARDQLIGVEHLGDEELEGIRQAGEDDAGSEGKDDAGSASRRSNIRGTQSGSRGTDGP